MICMNDCANCENPICKHDIEDENIIQRKKGNHNKANRYERKRKYKDNMMKKMTIVREDGSRFSKYYPVMYTRYYKRDDESFHIVRYYMGRKYYKKQASRAARRNKNDIGNYSDYKKHYPYKWMIW